MRHYTTENENLTLSVLPSLLCTVAFISASPRQIFTARHWYIYIYRERERERGRERGPFNRPRRLLKGWHWFPFHSVYFSPLNRLRWLLKGWHLFPFYSVYFSSFNRLRWLLKEWHLFPFYPVYFGPFNRPRRLLKGWHLFPFYPVVKFDSMNHFQSFSLYTKWETGETLQIT